MTSPQETSNDATSETGADTGFDPSAASAGDPTADTPIGTAEKDPQEWVTGDEPMTGPQRSYLHTLSQQAGQEPPSDSLSKADASALIDELQAKTGRGA